MSSVKQYLSRKRYKPTVMIFAGLVVAVLSVTGYFMVGGSADALACTQTVTPSQMRNSPYDGDNVNTIVKGAGSTHKVICLGADGAGTSATFGGIALYGANPASVVIQPAPGIAVSVGEFILNGVSNVTITGFSGASSSDGIQLITGEGNNQNITYSYNAMTSTGVTIRDNELANANILIDHNTFIGFTNSGESTRINILNDNACPNGITISNNLISGGQADGVDMSGPSCGTKIIHNEFKDIIEANCGGIHCDAYQDNGGGTNTLIDSNYFHNVSDCWLMDDGSTNTIITNNVCATASDSSYWMQFGGAKKITLDHNTIISTTGATYGTDHGGTPSSNVTFTNNIMYSTPSLNPGQNISGTTTIDHNLCKSSCIGSASIAGTPTFTGGTTPTTFAGFALMQGSAGKQGALDHTDIGAIISGGGTTPPPPLVGDFNGSGSLDQGDVTILTNKWNAAGVTDQDLNGDKVVNIYDLSKLLSLIQGG